jgi:hypothetical protein
VDDEIYAYHCHWSLLSPSKYSKTLSEFIQWVQHFCYCWTDILESHVGWSVIVPEFQRHPGNDTLVAVISFLETRRNHKRPNQASKEGGDHSHVFSCQKLLHSQTVFTSTLSWWMIHAGMFHKRGLTCQKCLKWYFYQSSLTILRTSSMFLSVRPVKGWPEHSQPWIKVFQCFNWENHLKVCALPIALSLSYFEHFMCFWCSSPKTEVKLNANALFLQISH